jgi:hypothetical protein
MDDMCSVGNDCLLAYPFSQLYWPNVEMKGGKRGVMAAR